MLNKDGRVIETAVVMLCLGVLLLMPPLILIFDKPVSVLGIPLLPMYIFGVWLALIIIAMWQARKLPRRK